MIKDHIFEVKGSETVKVEIPPFNIDDRIYIVLNTSSRIELESTSLLRQLPYDVEGLPFDFADWLLFQQRLCFIAEQTCSDHSLELRFLDPEFTYAIKTFEGEINYTLSSYNNLYAKINLYASTNQKSRFQQIILIYPYHEHAEQDFRIEGSFELLNGKIHHIMFIVITIDRNWLTYQIASQEEIFSSRTISFNINSHNQTIYGHTLSNDFGKQIQYLAITIGLDSKQWSNEREAYASIGIGKIKIQNKDRTTIIEPTVQDRRIINSKVYVFHKFKPTNIYISSLIILTFLFSIGALILARITGFKILPSRLLKSFITTKAVSDYRPNTYLAKLFHKPRYDKLRKLLLQYVGEKISTLVDVGCGLGVLNKYLKENNFDVKFYIGCDIDKKALKTAEDIERVVCDLNNLPFKDNTAEIIVCSEVLEHMPNPYIGFKELLRISKKWIFLSFPDERIKNALGIRYPEHKSEPSVAYFITLADKKNFKLLKKEKIFFAFPPSVLDRAGLRYTAPYQPIITKVFQILSELTRDLSLIKTMFLVFRKTFEKI